MIYTAHKILFGLSDRREGNVEHVAGMGERKCA